LLVDLACGLHQLCAPMLDRLDVLPDNALAYRHSTDLKQAVAQLRSAAQIHQSALSVAKRQG
jgi:hypothetical protein